MTGFTKTLTFKAVALIIGAALLLMNFANDAISTEFLKRGADSSSAAARAELQTKMQERSFYPYAMDGGNALPDTLAEEFSEEEEGKHLVRDIGIFVMVSVFVGYFLIKVFLEGDKEESPSKKGGKDFPNALNP